MTVHVEAPGLLTTLQDLGRPGYQHLGVGTSGAMDEVSHRIANLLVGNPPGAAALEITLAGPRLRFECDALVAVCGGDFAPRVADVAVRRWRPVLVRAGSVLEFGPAVQGARCCLAVAGGFRVPPVLASASTNLVARFGGFQGRPLAAGDRLAIAPPGPDLYPGLQWECAHYREPARNLGWFAAWYRELDFLRPARLRFIPGPQWPLLTEASRAALLAGPFQAGARSDRMGIRLQGPVLALERPLEMLSAGVAPGTLQLPPDGSPIDLSPTPLKKSAATLSHVANPRSWALTVLTVPDFAQRCLSIPEPAPANPAAPPDEANDTLQLLLEQEGLRPEGAAVVAAGIVVAGLKPLAAYLIEAAREVRGCSERSSSPSICHGAWRGGGPSEGV